jgi:3-oxoacyl-[acyl-carrier protein] reductase
MHIMANAPRTTALVTGASRGIGRAIAQALAAAGCEVLLVARDATALAQTAAEIQAGSGTQTHWLAADLATLSGTAEAAARAQSLFPKLDALVNNAGATVRANLLTATEADWEDGFALKFMSPVRLCRALWPMLIAAEGSVLNIAGAAARTPTADFIVGAAVNAAILSLTKSLADQGGADGVRVNALNPGIIATGRLQKRIDAVAARDGTGQAESEQTLAREWGVRRIGRPEEIAAMAAFLTIGGGTYCHGGIYDVDGGATKGL